jgi:tetratricopeptide (TPR) repeat protein
MRVHERTAGNPFFLEEIARSLRESGTIRVESRRARLAGSIDALHMPANVQAVIRTRLDRLDMETRQVLRAAAVVGRDFTSELLKRVLTNPDRVEPALEALSAAGVIRQTAVLPDHGYVFAHVLVQEAAYTGLLEHQRAELHARAGHALEELYAGQLDDWLDRLAQHFSLAENWSKAVGYCVAAADRMRGLHQLVEAMRLLDRAREWTALLDDEQRRSAVLDILFRQERVCDLLGFRERQRQIADELVAMLESGGEPALLAEAYLHKGELHSILREFEEAEVALEASLRLRREIGDPLGERASLRGLGFLRWWQRRYDDALACNQAALAIDRHHQRVSAIVGDLHNLGAIYTAMRDFDRSRQCFEEALTLSEPARGRGAASLFDLWEARMAVLYSYGSLLASTGELDRSLTYLGSSGEWTCDQNPERAGDFLIASANIQLRKGMIDEGLDDYRRAIEITRANHLAPRLGRALQSYGETLIALGREREALAALSEATQVFEKLSDRPVEAAAWSHLAQVHERVGNVSDAQAAWQQTLRLCRETANLEGEVEALEALGRVARRHLPSAVALRFYEDAIARATALDDDRREARLHNSAGIIEWTRGNHRNAIAHFEHARDLFDRVGDRVAVGQMMNCIGVSLSSLGRNVDARDLLQKAVAHHADMEQPRLEAHALAGLGDSYWLTGDHDQAVAWYERSLQKRRSIADLRGEGWMLHRLARAGVSAGRATEAEALLSRASDISVDCSDEELMEECARLRHAIEDPHGVRRGFQSARPNSS